MLTYKEACLFGFRLLERRGLRNLAIQHRYLLDLKAELQKYGIQFDESKPIVSRAKMEIIARQWAFQLLAIRYQILCDYLVHESVADYEEACAEFWQRVNEAGFADNTVARGWLVTLSGHAQRLYALR